MSLEDIGRFYGASRVAVYKKLKKYGILQRSKSEARLEAQKQGNVPQDFFDINEDFFCSWSPEMAYVFGLIPFGKSPGFNPGMNGDFFKAGGSPGL